jgi:hypothetical protein
MLANRGNVCAVCHFFDDPRTHVFGKQIVGVCRRNAPVGRADGEFFGRSAGVMDDGWCGEFRAPDHSPRNAWYADYAGECRRAGVVPVWDRFEWDGTEKVLP